MGSGNAAVHAVASPPHAFRNPGAGLTAEQFLRKIVELRPMIRAQQEQADARGGYLPEVHQALLAIGAYGALQPRRYGGHEFDLPTFLKAVIEMARSDPGSAWCYAFAAAHVLIFAGHFSEKAQEELFRRGNGLAIGPLRAPTPAATIRKADGGYIVDGTWDYGSGIAYANVVFATAKLVGEGEEGPPEFFLAAVPSGQFRVVADSWGGDSTLGLRASASHTFVVERQFLPEHLVVPFYGLQRAGEDPQGNPGTRLHGNPMYLALTTGFFNSVIAGCIVGAAWAALDEFEEIIRTKRTINPPFHERYKSPEFQRVFGSAFTGARTAELLILEFGNRYMEYCERWKAGTPYTAKDDLILSSLASKAGQIASECVEQLFHAGGSTGAKRGQRLNRYFRDVATYRTHPIAQFEVTWEATAQAYFDLSVPMLEAVGGSRSRRKP